MSYGIAICSACKREVHQDGDRDVALGWRHCEDGSVICDAGHAVSPESTAEIVGKWCGRDAGPDEQPREYVLTNPFAAPPAKRRRGNKYFICPCGSFKPWANCCGSEAARE